MGSERVGVVRIAALVLVAIMAGAQTKPTKPFTPPTGPIDPGWVFGGPLMKDVGCAKDFVKSEAMEGLEKRKYIAGLITYGCGVQLRGFYIAQALESKTFTAGATTMVFRHVLLSNYSVLLSQAAYGSSADTATTLNTKEGWIPQSAISKARFTPEQLAEIAKKVRDSGQ